MLEDYISFAPQSKELILKKKTVLSLCQQAESRVEQIKSLEPDTEEGLIATVEVNKIQIKLHFMPEKITLHKDYLQGEIRLLNPPKFETESLIYRSLIAGWQIFLGGKIPNGVLPEEVRVEKDKIYYKLPRQQLQLIDILFHTLESNSALFTNVKQGELTIQSSVTLNWSDLKLQNILQLLQK
ncbi:hypothetical protein [Calothrix sp. UHCC 0171]|uniref:hypothetical protein n=1 Tax=Calothrix sp. UHCC 0171 TaxID=3110245 RepID=UPI002B220FD7|nr:hypothetical protein [Calothrix sp. UHCC 0171]MEA5569869.1 hypothetical protein [Calothrix sp. UHCC 0171]